MTPYFSEYNCPQCGKHFVVADTGQWIYRVYNGHSNKYICSWKCLQEFRRTYDRFKRDHDGRRHRKGRN